MPEDPDKTKPESSAPGSPLAQAADRIRESAKWLLVSFAAVGATLIAGLQLASIGELTNDGPEDRLTWAVVGLVLGLTGVVLAIGAASSVVTKSFVTLKWLAGQGTDSKAKRGIEGDQALLGGYETVDELRLAFDEAMENRRDKLLGTYQDPADPAKRTAADAADKWAIALGNIQRHVLDQASFNRVRASYGTARWGILVGAALTAAGIAVFAWAANPPAREQVPVVSHTPADVIARIDPEDRATFRPQLGTDCDLSRVHAVALSASGEAFQLASVPTENCKSALFSLGGEQGRVAPVAEDQEPLAPGNPSPPHAG